MMTRKPEEVLDALKKAESIVLISHISPDGDTIGSGLALRLGLEQLGKKVVSVCSDPVPGSLMMLAEADCFVVPETIAEGSRFDLVMAVDCGDLSRTGTGSRLFAMGCDTAQVDHHGTNPGYTAHNDVDGTAPAVALLVYGYLKELGVTITPEIAECLYAGLSTDTGNFAFPSTNAATFQAMSDLMDSGLQLAKMNRALFREHPKGQVMLLKCALNSMKFYGDDRMTMMQLTQDDFVRSGALPEHSDTIVNYGLDIGGVKMAALLREAPENKIKVSLRAIAPCRVDGIAHAFGGGGHPLASGCTLAGLSLAEAGEQLRKAMEAELEQR